MTIGRDRTQHAVGDFEQHAVEVIANILLGHGEPAALDDPTQLALIDAEVERTRPFLDCGEVVGRQGRQRKAAAARFDHYLLLIEPDADQRIRRQALADVHQFARWNGDLTGFAGVFEGHASYQLDFQVGPGQRQLLVLNDQQHVGQYRQRLPPLDDTGHQLQWFQQGFALNGEMHGLVPCLR